MLGFGRRGTRGPEPWPQRELAVRDEKVREEEVTSPAPGNKPQLLALTTVYAMWAPERHTGKGDPPLWLY